MYSSRRLLRLITAGLLAAVAAASYYLYTPKLLPPQLNSALQTASIDHDGIQRDYLFYIPQSLSKNPPLVFMLHGSRQSIADIREFSGYEFEKLADQHGFILIYPAGFENHWNDCRGAATYSAREKHIDDLGFINALAETFHRQYQSDSNKTFIAGFSNGAQLAYRFALEQPERVAAIAAISANLPTADNLACQQLGKAVPVLIMNGSEDHINPYYGGQVTLFGAGNRGQVKSAVASAEYFANLAGFTGSPSEIKNFPNIAGDPTSAKYYAWRDRDHPEVILYTIADGGHVIPQSNYRAPRILGTTSVEINGPAEIWAFFARQITKENRKTEL